MHAPKKITIHNNTIKTQNININVAGTAKIDVIVIQKIQNLIAVFILVPLYPPLIVKLQLKFMCILNNL